MIPARTMLCRSVLTRRAALLNGRGARFLCEMEDRGKAREAAYFRTQEAAALDKLKAKLASSKPMDETDERARLAKILDSAGIAQDVRANLKTQLILWKHDEDIHVKY